MFQKQSKKSTYFLIFKKLFNNNFQNLKITTISITQELKIKWKFLKYFQREIKFKKIWKTENELKKNTIYISQKISFRKFVKIPQNFRNF